MTSNVSEKVTIIVLTYNRYPFLLRLLRYYIACESPIAVHILDSSSDVPVTPEFERLIQDPRFTYIKFEPSCRPYTKLFKGLETVTTPYAVSWADDDFLVPKTLQRGVDFLEANPDFSAAHGEAGIFSVSSSGTGQVISGVGPYCQTSIIDQTAIERFKSYLVGGVGSIFYSVQRTENLVRNLAQCHEHEFGWMWGELALGCLCAVQGKTKKLDPLYLMREIHSGRDSLNDGKTNDVFDWVTGADFSNKYSKLLLCLSDALAQQDGISREEAREVVKEVFWHRISKGLTRIWHYKYASGAAVKENRLRTFIKGLPGTYGIWSGLRSMMHRSGEMSLPALLNPSSSYHADFMPIYHAVTDPRCEMVTR